MNHFRYLVPFNCAVSCNMLNKNIAICIIIALNLSCFSGKADLWGEYGRILGEIQNTELLWIGRMLGEDWSSELGFSDYYSNHDDDYYWSRGSGHTTPDSRIKWELPTGGPVYSSPAVDEQGNLYLATWSGYVFGLNIMRTTGWDYFTGANMFSSPAIGPDGTVYVGTLVNELLALTPSGQKKWAVNLGNKIGATPAVAPDGTVYVGSYDYQMHAIRPDGSKKWAYRTGSQIGSSAAVGPDGTVYFGSYDGNLYALRPDGSKKWQFATGDKIFSSPALSDDGTIYFGSYDDRIYALHPDGTKKWHYQTGGNVESSPVLAADRTVYVGSHDGNFYALNPEGGLKWTFTATHLEGGTTETNYWDTNSTPTTVEVPSPIGSTAAVGKDGTIYFGSYGGTFYALNPDGTKKWDIRTGGQIFSCPVIDAEGTLYFGSLGERLYGLYTEGKGLADSPWPMFHQGGRHSGSLASTPAPTERPKLTIKRSSTGQITLSWPASATGYVLECTGDLSSPTGWIELTGSIEVISGQNVMTQPSASACQFFRLRSVVSPQ